MTSRYRAIAWNRQKRIYDATLGVGIVLYLAAFVGATLALRPNVTIETALIRAFGTCAFVLLHIALSIGPLARLDRRWLVLLYNRRHLGVATFAVALVHGALSMVQFHGFSDRNPLLNLLTANTRFDSIAHFPFQPLGLLALTMLLLLAATSHDFWLANLSPSTWKRLHMMGYLAYALVFAHVALGTVQSQTNQTLAVALGAGFTWLLTVHVAAGFRDRRIDRETRKPADEGFIDVCSAEDIPDGRAHIAAIGEDRVAIFRHGDALSAVSNACAHQNGPLGEGRIIDGCIVCPWHGYEYQPKSGQSPPPFSEKIPTFTVKVVAGRVWIYPRPHPPGTVVEPALIDSASKGANARGEDATTDFYVGYQQVAPPSLLGFIRRTATGLVVASVGISLILSTTQERFDPGTFEFGKVRAFSGKIAIDPYPVLSVRPPGVPEEESRPSRFVLVGFGKAGAEHEVDGAAGPAAKLEGTLVYRNDMTMIELDPGSVSPQPETGTSSRSGEIESLGEFTFTGEIVDLKCFLGVMKPGRGKPHRACATNCIRGGIPPVLVVTDLSSPSRYLLLADRNERPVGSRILDVVAEPIEITGEVVRKDNLFYLKADPGTYRRLTG